jgi:hypothetical protein
MIVIQLTIYAHCDNHEPPRIWGCERAYARPHPQIREFLPGISKVLNQHRTNRNWTLFKIMLQKNGYFQTKPISKCHPDIQKGGVAEQQNLPF